MSKFKLSKLAYDTANDQAHYCVASCTHAGLRTLEGVVQFSSITELVVSHNELGFDDSDDDNEDEIDVHSPLLALKKLAVLDLSHNQLDTVLPWSHSEGSPVISEADYSFNRICTLQPNLGAEHVLLKKLNLDDNNLDSLDGLQNAVSLTWLSVNNNQLENLNGIEGLSLLYLSVHSNLIDDLLPLAEVPSLLELNVSNQKISSVQDLHNLKHLVKLTLDDTTVTDIGCLSDLLHLRELSVQRTTLVNVLSLLRHIPQIRILNGEAVQAEQKVAAFNRMANP